MGSQSQRLFPEGKLSSATASRVDALTACFWPGFINQILNTVLRKREDFPAEVPQGYERSRP